MHHRHFASGLNGTIMQTQKVSFDNLLAPITREEFFSEYFGKKPLYIPGSDDKVAGLFGWTDLDEMLHEGRYWNDANLSLVVEGKALPSAEYSHSEDMDSGHAAARIDRAKLIECLKRKPSLILNFCQTQTAEIASLTATLESVFRASVELHIIASWENQKGYVSHFDYNDVLIFQTEGVKTWNVYEGRYEEPLKGTDHDRGKLMPQTDTLKGRLLMQPQLSTGDVLYLPKGQFHDALAASEATLHLSYRFEHSLGMDYMKMIMSNLHQLPSFREPLPHFDDTEAHDEKIGRLIEELATLVRDRNATEFAANYQKIISTQDAFQSFTLPSEEPILFYRVRHDQNFETLPVDEFPSDVLSWIKARDFFNRDQLINAFIQSGADRLDAMLINLEAARLIEKRL
jgi:ribosomal protein L16 Arg81 hydroxylase